MSEHADDQGDQLTDPPTGSGEGSNQPTAPARRDGSAGGDLLRVLRAALATAPGWWSAGDLTLVAAAVGLPGAVGDLLARLLTRTRHVARRASFADAEQPLLDRLAAANWLVAVTPASDAAGVVACLGLEELGHPGPRAAAEVAVLGDPAALAHLDRHGPFVGVPAAARRLAALAGLAAFAGHEDLSLLARVAIGQIRPDPASALGRTLAGQRVPLVPLPWPDRAAAEAALVAWEARAAGPSPAVFSAALAAVQAAEGRPLHLVHHHLLAIHHWTRLLWRCCQDLALDPRRRHAARRALRRAPCAPPLAREVWEDLHAAWRPRSAADRLARAFAAWPLWGEVEREAWAARSDGTRRKRTAVWATRTIDAWMERGATRVVAEGELVEDLALRRLAADGWQGVHAEGGFWLAAAHLLLDDGPQPWCAPLQTAPLDWGRWGYGARRRTALRARAGDLVRDREAALAAALARATQPLPGFLAAPPAEALTAVVRHLPARVLVPLLTRILDHPGEAGGLPDLVVWRGEAVAFWEVKSPGDQLSAKQRRWLAWLTSEGITAGALRLAAKRPVQTTLFSGGAAATAGAAPTPVARPRPARQRAAAPGGSALLLAGAAWRPEAGAAVPGQPRLVMAMRPWRDARAELPFVDDVLLPIPAAAVLVEVREGRRVRLRRWFPLPAGRVLVGAVRDEARPGGGVGPCLRLLTRAAGWLIPAALAGSEPVVARPDELADPTRDWVPHPDEPPPRAEHLADAWGCGDQLRDQLMLLGAEPHGVWLADDHLRIALAADCPVFWAVDHPRLVRDRLPDGVPSR